MTEPGSPVKKRSTEWRSELYLHPGDWIPWVAAAVVGLVIILGSIVIGLNEREKVGAPFLFQGLRFAPRMDQSSTTLTVPFITLGPPELYLSLAEADDLHYSVKMNRSVGVRYMLSISKPYKGMYLVSTAGTVSLVAEPETARGLKSMTRDYGKMPILFGA